MTPSQIEGMIDRICGLFPSGTIALNKVKHAWTADDFLLLQDVDDARRTILMIMERHDKFPSLKDVHIIFRELKRPRTLNGVIKVCEICDGNGWDTGRRWNFDTKELVCEGYTKELFGQTYSYVMPCRCRGVA